MMATVEARKTKLEDYPRYPLMFGRYDLVNRGEIERSSNVLFPHLGGQPALNAYSGMFRS